MHCIAVKAWITYHIHIMDRVLFRLVGLIKLESDDVDDPKGSKQGEPVEDGVDIIFHHETAQM